MPGGIRTPNLLIRSQLLYPVELQTRLIFDFGKPGLARCASCVTAIFDCRFGRGNQKDLLVEPDWRLHPNIKKVDCAFSREEGSPGVRTREIKGRKRRSEENIAQYRIGCGRPICVGADNEHNDNHNDH